MTTGGESESQYDRNRRVGYEYEDYIAGLLRRRGETVAQTPHFGDYGVDLVITAKGERWAVQVKHTTGWVGQKAVREAVAGMAYYHCTRSMVITNSHNFGSQARQLAAANRCMLVGGDTVTQWVREDKEHHKSKAASPRRDKAVNDLRQAGSATAAENLAARATSFTEQGRYAAAIQCWGQLIARDGLNATALAERARVHELAGHAAEAIADLASAIQLAPTDPRLPAARGLALLSQGAYDEAISDLGLALRLDPASAKSHYHRGTAYARLGHDQAALEDMNAALALDPTLMDALSSRDVIEARLRQPEAVA